MIELKKNYADSGTGDLRTHPNLQHSSFCSLRDGLQDKLWVPYCSRTNMQASLSSGMQEMKTNNTEKKRNGIESGLSCFIMMKYYDKS